MSIRIERLAIRDFGPLRDLLLEPDDVTVVFGPNEAGKTSCIDALVRALRERVRSGNKKLIEGFREDRASPATSSSRCRPTAADR